jgi:tRNA-specific 2-thiouridylase
VVKVAVALSGGVDSSTCTALMKEAGHEVITITLDLFPTKDHPESTIRAAQRIARHLDVPHHIYTIHDLFKRHVTDPFVQSYCRGETPLPCACCNRHIKFGSLFAFARSLGAEVFVTGHYVCKGKTPSGEVYLRRALNAVKDQSYFLFGVEKEVLPFLDFPLGEFTKPYVRALARTLGLPSHDRAESQDICFVGKRSYVAFVQEQAPPDLIPRPGPVVDHEGHFLGEHPGLIHYTVGQRKGLPVSLGYPAYVLAMDVATRTLVVGPKEHLVCAGVLVKDVNWHGPCPTIPFQALAKVRSTQEPVLARVEVQGTAMHVLFQEPEYGVAIGQACVLYEEDRLLGGGWIDAHISL